jgi:CheY-like chemotaxis protein
MDAQEKQGKSDATERINICTACQRNKESLRLQPSMNMTHQKFVLCVDDDIDDRLFICEAIKDADPSLMVVEAKNGVEANEFLQKAKITGNFPCLVILDINMPLMDGKETLKEIKKDEILKTLPVVFFSTSSNPRDQSFSMEYGVDFVTKPANYRLVVETIKELLSKCND